MKTNKFLEVERLIKEKKIQEAQFKLSKMGSEFLEDSEYLYLRSKIFFLNKLYYLAIDTLLIALEFEKSDKNYKLISEIYNVLGNKELSAKFLDINLRSSVADSLKNEMSGIYRKKTLIETIQKFL